MVIPELVRIAFIIVATVTWYSPQCTNGHDPYVAAYWHNELPGGAPAEVDYQYFGVATASRDITFGTQIRFTVIGMPKWAREEHSDIIGNTVIATVIDRLGEADGEVDFDLWPAAFLKLTGDLDVGVVYVKAEILEKSYRRMLWELEIK